jgi:plastocyanin
MQVRPILVLSGALLLVLATACNGAIAAAPAQLNSQAQAAPTIDMTSAPYQFSPATLTVPAGTTVTWTTTSSDAHTVTDDPSKAVTATDAALPAGVEPWDSGLVATGQSYSHTFTTPGTYKYFCIPHESLGMVATVTVT